MKNLSLRFIVALITFCAGVALAGVWLIHRHSQNQTAKPEVSTESKIPSDTLITLHRTGCYGECPTYTLTIAADGTVVFHALLYWVREGKADSPKQSGIVMSRVSQGQLRQIISEFEKANYFSLQDSYTEDTGCPSATTDMPTAYTSIQINGRRKAIQHYYGCRYENTVPFEIYPRELTELEKRIDEIVNTKQWMQ